MDSLETLSNCSDSDSLSSNISNLSGYHSEFLDLKHNLTGTKYKEPRQQDLWRAEVKFNERIEKLLRHNGHLEKSLENANSQIERLIKNSNNDTVLLEKRNHELNVKNLELLSEIIHCKHLRDEAERASATLNFQLNNLNVELSSKCNIVKELKDKIASQHVEVQNLSKHNVKLAHSFDALHNDLDFVKKSAAWYKDQLHQCQNEKKGLLIELGDAKKLCANHSGQVENLNCELDKWRLKCDELELKTLKEKEELLKKLEAQTPLNRLISNKPLQFNSVYFNPAPPPPPNTKYITNYYESTLKDLSEEIARIKLNIEDGKEAFKKASKEKSEVLSKHLQLQKIVQQKDFEIEHLERDKNELKHKLGEALASDKQSRNQVFQLNNALVALQIELDAKNRENVSIEEQIGCVKEQFQAFKGRFEAVQNELHKKNQENLQLQVAKQELFMKNSWQTCELEKSKALEAKIKPKLFFTRDVDSSSSSISKDLERFLMNNFINLNNGNIIKMLEHVCRLFDIDNDDDVKINGNDEQMLRVLLGKIDRCFGLVQEERRKKEMQLEQAAGKLGMLKGDIGGRVKKLEERCECLRRKNEECLSLLAQFLQDESEGGSNLEEEVKHLRALVQVKVREQKDKQKRYETNYRTLLRKVKEHMRGRNASEKHNRYLQDLYNNLSDEHNSLKLQTKSRENEIDNLRTLNDGIAQKLKRLSLDKRSTGSQCQKCVENEVVKKRHADQLGQLHVDVANLENKLDVTQALLEEKSKELSSKDAEIERITREVLVERERAMLSKEAVEKNRFLQSELEFANSNLRRRAEDIEELKMQLHQFEDSSCNKSDGLQGLISALKLQLQTFRDESSALKSEKFFLQRLCNDLKASLKYHVNRNKDLERRLGRLEKGEEFSSLPVNLLPDLPATNYDEVYKLLQQTQAPSHDQPLSDIQSCLDTLKREISGLQQQIVDSNLD